MLETVCILKDKKSSRNLCESKHVNFFPPLKHFMGLKLFKILQAEGFRDENHILIWIRSFHGSFLFPWINNSVIVTKKVIPSAVFRYVANLEKGTSVLSLGITWREKINFPQPVWRIRSNL